MCTGLRSRTIARPPLIFASTEAVHRLVPLRDVHHQVIWLLDLFWPYVRPSCRMFGLPRCDCTMVASTMRPAILDERKLQRNKRLKTFDKMSLRLLFGSTRIAGRNPVQFVFYRFIQKIIVVPVICAVAPHFYSNFERVRVFALSLMNARELIHAPILIYYKSLAFGRINNAARMLVPNDPHQRGAVNVFGVNGGVAAYTIFGRRTDPWALAVQQPGLVPVWAATELDARKTACRPRYIGVIYEVACNCARKDDYFVILNRFKQIYYLYTCIGSN